jgi:hypothetical protein
MEFNNFTDKVILEPVYITDEGHLEFINPTDTEFIQKKIDDKSFQLVFHLHSVDCACVYGILTNHKWMYTMEIYNYLMANPYNKMTLYKLLIKGEFDLGISRINRYHIITEISEYFDDDNIELRQHYTQSKYSDGNIYWRSLNWDLFDDIVRGMSEQEAAYFNCELSE